MKYMCYFPKCNNNIVRQIDTSLKTISQEILKLYFLTRNKNNEDLYDSLPKQYKKILYDLHGIYMQKKKEHLEKQQKNPKRTLRFYGNLNEDIIIETLKTMEPKRLFKIYYERSLLIKNDKCKSFINTKCMETARQIKLMFG